MFLMEHFQEGGWGMWPILILAIATIVIIVEQRLIYIQDMQQSAISLQKKSLTIH